MLNKALFSSEKHDWETPQDLFDKLNSEVRFTCDVAASRENAKCEEERYNKLVAYENEELEPSEIAALKAENERLKGDIEFQDLKYNDWLDRATKAEKSLAAEEIKKEREKNE